MENATAENIVNIESKLTPPSEIGQWTIKEIEAVLSRPIPAHLLKTLEKKNKKTGEAKKIPYLPWYEATVILSKYCPGWTGKVTNIQQIGEELVLTYQLSIPTAEGVITRESTGSELINYSGYGESAANAESQAFRRCCAKFGLGLYLYRK